MLRIEIVNDGKHVDRPARGSYYYKVFVNSTLIADGYIPDFDRSLGWIELNRRVLAEAEKREQITAHSDDSDAV